MKRPGESWSAALVGASLGALFLGLGGRAATAALAAALGKATNPSAPGIAQSLLVGLLLGTAGGLLLPVVRRFFGGAAWWPGLVVAAVLFHLTLTLSWFGGRLELGGELPATLIVIAAAFVVFGVVLDRVLVSHPTGRGTTRELDGVR